MSFVLRLSCRACSASTDKQAFVGCPACGGPLDPVYDWSAIAAAVDRDSLGNRPQTIWRYRELLPLDQPPRASLDVACTPLVEAPCLAKQLGIGRVWLKCDAFSFPSLSFKDRPVAVALNKALELGITTVGCPSTGNLANAVAAHAARAQLDSWILIPDNIETGKIVGTEVYQPRLVRVRGTYDQINRLTASAAIQFGWGVVNVNLRSYYAEGSKTQAFEIAEQLHWRLPSAVVAPMGGGALVTKLAQGFAELMRLGWVEGPMPKIFGGQAAGCAPIATAVQRGTTEIRPVEPNTIATSIAIGDPVDGAWAAQAVLDSEGWAVVVTDKEIVEGIRLLAELAGVFTEAAGGVTVSGARQLAAEARLLPDDEVVLAITGTGLKTIDPLAGVFDDAPLIEPEISRLEELVQCSR